MNRTAYQDSFLFHTPWPSGVVARYLTAASATVDITQRPRFVDTDQLLDAIATCTGCGDLQRFAHLDHDEEEATEILGYNTDEARTWAQRHAETCRAMVRPGGA